MEPLEPTKLKIELIWAAKIWIIYELYEEAFQPTNFSRLWDLANHAIVLPIIQSNHTFFFLIWTRWLIIFCIFEQISVATIGFSIYRYIIVEIMLKSLLADPNLYADFTNLAFWTQTFQNGAGITIFVSWIKIFKYISFNKTMVQLSGTLTQVKIITKIMKQCCSNTALDKQKA